MRNTEHLGLALYDASDKMNITGADNSLNHNMELLDAEVARKLDAPEGGVSGQVMTMTEGGVAWADAPDGGNADGAVLYTEQALDEAQQAVARANIGAAEASELNSLSQSAASMGTEIDTLNGIILSNRQIARQYAFTVTVNKHIYAGNVVFDDLSIASGREYRILFAAGSGLYTSLRLYEQYDDGTSKSVATVDLNVEKTLSAGGNIVGLAIYLDKANIAESGEVQVTVSYTQASTDSLQARMGEAEKAIRTMSGAVDRGYVYTAEIANEVTSAAKEFYVETDSELAAYKKGDCLLIDVQMTVSEQISWLDHRFTWDDGTMWRLGYPTRDANNPNRMTSFVCTMVLDRDRSLKKIANYCSTADGNTEAARYEVKYTIEKVYSSEEEIPLPDYYHDGGYIEGKADAICGILDECAANGDAFIYLTDIHWEQNAMRSPAIIRYLREHTGIDTVLNGGDNYFGRPTTGTRDVTLALRRAVGDRVYLSDGNHEYAGFVDAGLTYGAKFGPNNQHTRDAVYGSEARTYYYVDRPDSRMRYVFLQAYGFDETAAQTAHGFTSPMKDDLAQLEWFVNVALNVEAGYTIVVVAHCFYTFDGSGNPVLMDGAQGYADAINNYSGAGTIACVLSGHTHRDAILYLGADGGGVPNILTTCDKFMPYDDSDLPNGIAREPHTISEQAVDVFIIDKTNRQIRIVRVGAQAGEWSGNADAGTRVEMREATY